MKFELREAKHLFVKNKEPEVNMLRSLGFEFEELEEPMRAVGGEYKYRTTGKNQIEIDTLEDLLNLMDKCDYDLILSKDSITIYNDYVE